MTFLALPYKNDVSHYFTYAKFKKFALKRKQKGNCLPYFIITT